jgi:mono/diheme cytochrome c family protein
LALLGIGCSAPPAPPPRYPALPSKQPQSAAASASASNDNSARLGGRLYDNFWRELKLDFVPDNPKTPEPDGHGGPFGNGTLAGADGKPILNTGHDYRLKNLLGWDLHGAAGISGQEFKATECVLLPDLLKNNEPREVWRARLSKGEDAIPAYASVLSESQIEALLDFMLGVRDGTLPQPEALFTLDPKVVGFYRLAAGGDAERGHALFEQTCKGCHGADGRAFELDAGKHTLGTFLRSEASEAWLKVLVGDAGSKMGPQLPVSATRAELTQQLLDLFAASCDRKRYPKGKGDDVPDGDPRCGAYLR